MADTQTGGGNPNFFTTFKGKHELAPSAGTTPSSMIVMVTCTNDVQVLGDFTLTGYTAGSAFATLPAECRPGGIVKFPVVVSTEQAQTCVVMSVGADGAMFLQDSYDSATVHMSGVSFNISDRWYRSV